MLIYASVNSAFSGFASLEIPLVIHVLKEIKAVQRGVEQPFFFTYGQKKSYLTGRSDI